MGRNGRRIFRAAVLVAVVAGSVWGQSAAAIRKAKALPSERVTVRKDGLVPAKITRPSGPFVLYVENRTGSASEGFRLDVEPQTAGAAIAVGTAAMVSMATLGDKWWDHALINLPPGTYRFSMASRSDWTLQLVITK